MKAGETETEEVGGEESQREKAKMKTLDIRQDKELRNPHTPVSNPGSALGSRIQSYSPTFRSS